MWHVFFYFHTFRYLSDMRTVYMYAFVRDRLAKKTAPAFSLIEIIPLADPHALAHRL